MNLFSPNIGQQKFGTLISGALDFLYPPRCVHCDASLWLLREAFLCEQCADKLRFVGNNFCRYCGEIFGEFARGVCAPCRRKRPHFTRAVAVVKYREPVAESLIKEFKYHHQRRLAKPLAELMTAAAQKHFRELKIDGITAVPLYPEREQERGYNQSAELAKVIGENLQLPLVSLLHRIRHTPPQARLRFGERQKNLAGAFIVDDRLAHSYQRVLLIDDVITTGATLNECARVLRTAGLKRIFGLSFAR